MRSPSALWLLTLGLFGCNETPKTQQASNEPSPNASILPAPLASALEPTTKPAGSDSSQALDTKKAPVIPEAMREDRPLPEDSGLRESLDMRLYAEFRWLDLPAFPRHPETNAEARERLRETSSFAFVIDVFQHGRLRVEVASELFVLPQGSEIRAREDYYGHAFIFDEGRAYASIPPGSLRALLSEGRADAAPLTKPKIADLGASGFLGIPTQKRELTTPLGRIVMDQAALGNAGLGGSLLCRMLAELIAAEPANAVCARRELPLRAELFSSGGGHLLFETKRVDREPALELAAALVPPPEARYAPEGPSDLGAVPHLQRPEALRQLRTRPVSRTERAEALAPKQGLTILNRTESLRYVLLDGLILGRIPPRREAHVEALVAGKYSLTSVDFFGDEPTPLRSLEVPARLAIGDAVEDER